MITVFGVGCVIAGIGKVYWPAALVVLGALCVAAGLFLFDDDEPRSSE